MNTQTKLTLALCLLSSLTASCIAPLALADPASARQSPSFQGQRRHGSRPTMDQGTGFGNQGPAPYQASMPQQQAVAQNPYGAVAQPAQVPLMGWGGEVAMMSQEGQTRMAMGDPKHGLEPAISNRMHILKLYQEVLEERELLEVELERLNKANKAGEELVKRQRDALKEMNESLASSEDARSSLLDQNRDLSARLTVAQIRRLESDKLLLETQIAMHTTIQFAPSLDPAAPILTAEK
jgi:hypothetical protein